ncbi:penicillin acylase family protein, partial [Parapedobacter sp. SGR-10]|uniref:penicillin acylase family protein n=1 Tax=Parapedobacter sp. SGR-10 TaxID=2710879 RepID=UPI0013F09FC8
NAYIEEILRTPDKLPIEFKILDILPGKWTPEVVVSRHQGLLQNVTEELLIGRSVAKLGVKKTKDLHWFHPHDPDIELDESIDKELLFDDILYLYKAFRKPIDFQIDDVSPDYRIDRDVSTYKNPLEVVIEDKFSVGSNNWVTSGELMADGHTYMACDPHRAVTVPSLRYMAHLVAPGW